MFSSLCQTPPVSVVIPTYKHARLIEETLASDFAQSFQDLEVIVVNDGSPNLTTARLRSWIDGGRLHYHVQPNAGHFATNILD